MTQRWLALEATAYLGAALIIAALVHLSVVLLVPRVATRDAFARLEPLGVLNETVALPRAGPKEMLLPYADPAVAMSFCRYDLTQGPIRATAPTGRAFASLSFHTSRGLVFYDLTDKAATRGVIGAVLATPDDIRALAARDDEENPSHDLRITAPDREGYVTMRVFSVLPSLYGEAQAQAKQLKCSPEPVPGEPRS
jgi:uncharacterized membrane protein